MRLMRMRFKRFLVFFFLLFVGMSSYMYYSLFFSPAHDTANVQEFEMRQQQQQQQSHAPLHHKNGDVGEDHRATKAQSGILRLFPQGVQKLLKQPEKEGEEETREDGQGRQAEDGHGNRLQAVMNKQRQIIQKQAQLLKQLEEKAALLQAQAGQAGPAPPLGGGRQGGALRPHTPLPHRLRGAQRGGEEGANHVMKLAIHGIQPRRTVDFREAEDHKEHAGEGQGAPHNIVHPPFHPHNDQEDEEEEQEEGAEKRFREAGRVNPNAVKNLNRANVFGKGRRLNRPPFIPQESQGDAGDAEGMFHQFVRNNPNADSPGNAGNRMFPNAFHNQQPRHAPAAMGANRQLGQPAPNNAFGGGPHVGAMDAQRMFRESARNNPLLNLNGGQPQLAAGNAPRAGAAMNRGFRHRHIASIDSAGRDLHAQDSRLLAERFRHVPRSLNGWAPGPRVLQPQNNTGLNEAVKLFNQMKRAEHFHVEVKDLTVPVNDTVKCVPVHMKSLARHLCVYPFDVDTKTSRQLIQTGTFNEEQELKEFDKALSTDQSLAAVDIGAALGIYSLLAASKSRQVLAVEPMKDHQRLFTKTMQINFLTRQVTLVANALGERKQFGLIRSPHPTGNMGAVYVDPVTDWAKIGSDVNNIVRMVRLDDLLPVTKFKSAVMKLDAQGDEEMVLRGARRFFDTIDVRYVLMHWLPTFNRDHLNECLMFLLSRGYVPTHSVSGNKTYSSDELQKDINFVVWRKSRP